MPDDADLLRRYVEERSEEAFAELVRRHIDLVYSISVRQVGGDAHHAKDVVQKVFSALATKAPTLGARPVLGGWLYRSAQFEASKLVRTERRRRAREQEASAMEEIMRTSESETDWEKSRPLLDVALAELGRCDRDVLVLRYLEGRSFAEVGAQMVLTENAARMRVERALNKLHGLLVRRGVTSSTAAIAVAIAGQSAVAAPLTLASSVTGAALSGAAATGSVAMIFMGITKLNLGIISALVVAATTGLVLQQQNHAEAEKLRQLQRERSRETSQLRFEQQRLERNVADAELFRADDVELARLRREAVALRVKESAAKSAAGKLGANDSKSQTVYDLKSLDVTPKPTFQSSPEYPMELKRSGITGQAVIGFVVADDGTLRDVRVVNATLPEFGVAAEAAVKRWYFSPGQKAGVAVNAEMNVPIVFSIGTNNNAPVPADWF